MSETKIPEALKPVLQKALDRLSVREDWPAIASADSRVAAALNQVLACSDYVTDVLVRYPQELASITQDGRIHRALEPGELEPLFLKGATESETETQFIKRLRVFRHRELMRIAFRDISGWSNTDETLSELSALADTCLRAAYYCSSAEMQRRYGVPRGADGEESVFIIVAMGKLGGGELNFSSDVDLVFIYSENGETDGDRSLTNEEYFRRLAQHFINLLSNKTADGFVYRVDARLRPFGDSGPLAVSVDAFEDYLVQHGRDWERYAWVKARIVNAWAGASQISSSVLRPFVYRRYLDFGVFGSLRDMKSMIEQEGRAAANRENIKLGPGGIREIEFIAQTLQLVRGGTVRSLRQRSLMAALAELAEATLMSATTVEQLSHAYRFLRDLENCIQAIADKQTHELPTNEVDQWRLCLAMGYANWDELYAALQVQRHCVQGHFDEILRHDRNADGAQEREKDAPGLLRADDDVALREIEALGFAEPAKVLQRLDALQASPQFTRMQKMGRQRLEQLVPAILRKCASTADSMTALERTLRVVESIVRRSAYIALLNESDAALERLVRLCSSSDFLARQVAAHPLLLDELLDPRMFLQAPTREDFERDIQFRIEATDAGDIEQQFEALRNFQQASVFRVAVADLSDTLPLMKVSDRLTDIAELVLEHAQELSIAELAEKHGVPCCTVDGVQRKAGFAVAGYGKLGGLELGYGSDLDIVFIHDSEGEDQQSDGEKSLENSVYFARLARRISHILTMPTPTGALYEVDTRLRPSGNSGLLVTSLVALDLYQKNDAWTWEHQALLRARAVAGNAQVRTAFENLRIHALQNYVRRDTLLDEVAKMRTRMRKELVKGTADDFDLKQGEGGVVDIEFLVQYLVLLNSPKHPPLLTYSDNIRQLDALHAAGILDSSDSAALADAYRAYRVRMHLLALTGKLGLLPLEEFAAERVLVQRLWLDHLGAAGA